MMISGLVAIFLCGMFGGALTEALRWYQLREAESLPAYARSPFYWAVTGAMIVIGGAVAVLYGTEPRNAILVLQIGISAPLIIKALAEAKAPALSQVKQGPRVPGFSMGGTAPRASLVNFLAGR